MLDIMNFNLKSQLSGLIILHDPVSIGPGGNVIVFNAQVDMSPDQPDANNLIKGCVQYWNGKTRYQFSEVGQYFVQMKIAQTPEKGVMFKDGQDMVEISSSDFDFVGDILMLANADNVEDTFPPVVDICGIATKIDKRNATFNLKSSQHLQLGCQKFIFPARAVVPDSPKFKDSASKERMLPPSESMYTSISGFLTHIITKPVKSGVVGPVQAFCIDVDSSANMGRPPANNPSVKETPG
ncbi:hypothetical protein Moror_8453 [Moniliophthora roreri MCA 2997]|uniref:Uncharacterized protein n=1 Tax=Moniliophthora roreri (strain MCA 2997) TaxID=1381753 RepID=V2XR84_MONRO|nr:hypothetical protein Moror_8453 [Moniliophthora roreri MCA 2997]